MLEKKVDAFQKEGVLSVAEYYADSMHYALQLHTIIEWDAIYQKNVPITVP